MIATGFYTGYSPFAPGTAGSLLIFFFLWFMPRLNLKVHIILLVLIFFAGVWSSSEVAKETGKDPSIVVIDEMTGVWIPLSICPKTMPAYLLALFLFRFFDILKPFPINTSEKLPNGLGIMLDDLIAGIYSFLVIGLFLFLDLL